MNELNENWLGCVAVAGPQYEEKKIRHWHNGHLSTR